MKIKIAAAQSKPIKNIIAQNIQKSLELIEKAKGCDAIFFSELSLSGYTIDNAKELAVDINDPIFNSIQQKSIELDMTIGVGVPIKDENGVHISMVVFQGDKRILYSKQFL